jgi:hypothetical protein
LREVDIGQQMVLAEVYLENLRDADVNAHVLPRVKMERLIANMKRRGAMESMLYCVQPTDEPRITIVSGHHRRKAALAAGIKTAWIMIDRSGMGRDEVIAKQLAHNFIVGTDDLDIVRQLLAQIRNPDALLASGAPEDILADASKLEAVSLFTPSLDFTYHDVMLAFLPHQMQEVDQYLNRYDQPLEALVVGKEEQFLPFLEAMTKFAKKRRVRVGATAIAELTRLGNLLSGMLAPADFLSLATEMAAAQPTKE